MNFWSFKTTFTKYSPDVYAINIPTNIDIQLSGETTPILQLRK